jgi:hypothetical protein
LKKDASKRKSSGNKNPESNIQQRTHNTISILRTKDDTRLENYKDIETELVSYYVDLLTEENCSRGNTIHRVSSNIPSIVINQHNVSLMCPITLQEVDLFFMQMKEDTAPGLDGFTIVFFHACWDILKLVILKIVEELHNLQWVLPSLNATFLTLIPKEENVVVPSKYRPIETYVIG